ncbi:MAG: hypothetical protein ABJH04_07395 [Cyclobacteriaceae bacterium]
MAKKGITLKGKNNKVIGEVYAESHNKLILLNIEEPVSINEIETIINILKSYKQKFEINLLRVLTQWSGDKEQVVVEKSFIGVLVERMKPLNFSYIALVVSNIELLSTPTSGLPVEVFMSATKADIKLTRIAMFEAGSTTG